ncbi:4-hydroxythreonine-4-phosphate dehydrogenase PdxA [Sporomusa sp.]|uniref:4-hydroxythreonine-4-phosphate dehydrogenase PdxA n=1 Tax=Sporomusa sp. TaxID=2078658 RepID=UPI002BDB9BAC|nr:4-hydroxythreonine-4-phosphate dehydrogenase PdxA [Sporomusa sp.]HWR42088.1 4-hydroxythreonine-4-phosphate dehydrogenase PdxA [Sporomusa sp.]
MKPILGITMGDAAGVGPEIIVKALADKTMYELCQPVVIGDKKILERAIQVTKVSLKCRAVEHTAEVGKTFGMVDVFDLDNLPGDIPFGVVDQRSGKAAYEYIAQAVKLALRNDIHAIVTAPINKEAVNLAGYHFPGHTEILAQLGGAQNYAMMLYSEALKVIHVTTHVALRNACELITADRVQRIIELANSTMNLIGITEPRIAVAGLNPHCGESGLFGVEDEEHITPAIMACKKQGINVKGPIAPDTVFYRAAIKKEFDIVVVMYHDQGHIPLKLLDFHNGVNVTVGLPFIRTSVDHGTAFDIAGKGIADKSSMIESIKLGALMASSKVK